MTKKLWIALVISLLWAGVAQTQTEIECPKPLIQDATPSYYIGMGDVYFARSNYSQAVLMYTCALELQSDFAPTYTARAYAYSELLDIEKAVADLDQALALDETLVGAYVNRGALYTTQGNFGLAINDFTIAVTLDPNNLQALNNRAVVHAIEGNYDLALADLNQALAIDDTYTQTYATFGAVYSALASKNYQKFVDLQGRNAKLPAGTPSDVLNRIDASLVNGDFSVWLALLDPAPR